MVNFIKAKMKKVGIVMVGVMLLLIGIWWSVNKETDRDKEESEYPYDILICTYPFGHPEKPCVFVRISMEGKKKTLELDKREDDERDIKNWNLLTQKLKENRYSGYPNVVAWDDTGQRAVLDMGGDKKRTILAYDEKSGEVQALGQFENGWGICNQVIAWDPVGLRLFAVSQLPVSSESYLKDVCIIDQKSGRVLGKWTLPGYQTKNYYQALADARTGRFLIGTSTRSFVANINVKTMQEVKIPGWADYNIAGRFLDEGKVMLQSGGEYGVYDMRNNNMGQIAKVDVKLEKVTNNMEWAVFREYLPEFRTCWQVFNMVEGIKISRICDSDLGLEKLGKEVIGWVIN